MSLIDRLALVAVLAEVIGSFAVPVTLLWLDWHKDWK